MPDQLAAAGLPDVDMFASLPLDAQVDLLETLRYRDPSHDIARVVGIDTLVSTGSGCPGANPVSVPSEGATVCDLEGSLKAPYWIPLAAASCPGTRGSPRCSRLMPNWTWPRCSRMPSR